MEPFSSRRSSCRLKQIRLPALFGIHTVFFGSTSPGQKSRWNTVGLFQGVEFFTTDVGQGLFPYRIPFGAVEITDIMRGPHLHRGIAHWRGAGLRLWR